MLLNVPKVILLTLRQRTDLQILTRLTPSITHIVFKDGSPTTLAKHKLYENPRPFLVGVGWVIKCAENREQTDESQFLVDEPEPAVLNGKVMYHTNRVSWLTLKTNGVCSEGSLWCRILLCPPYRFPCPCQPSDHSRPRKRNLRKAKGVKLHTHRPPPWHAVVCLRFDTWY